MSSLCSETLRSSASVIEYDAASVLYRSPAATRSNGDDEKNDTSGSLAPAATGAPASVTAIVARYCGVVRRHRRRGTGTDASGLHATGPV
jgi:hypothetical protein